MLRYYSSLTKFLIDPSRITTLPISEEKVNALN